MLSTRFFTAFEIKHLDFYPIKVYNVQYGIRFWLRILWEEINMGKFRFFVASSLMASLLSSIGSIGVYAAENTAAGGKDED